MLVDEQCSGGDFSKKSEAIEVAHRFVQKVAIEQAIVVDSRRGEGVADEKDFFSGVLLDEQRIVVDRLAGEVVECECEFFPSHCAPA